MIGAGHLEHLCQPGSVAAKERPEKEGKKAGAAAKGVAGDHNRGHGNDADGVDEDNPGKSRGK